MSLWQVHGIGWNHYQEILVNNTTGASKGNTAEPPGQLQHRHGLPGPKTLDGVSSPSGPGKNFKENHLEMIFLHPGF